MKADNPLDKHLTINRYPSHINDPAVFVADTLDIAWIAAQSVFEDKATPEVAIAIFDRIVSRMQVQSSFSDAPQQHSTNSGE